MARTIPLSRFRTPVALAAQWLLFGSAFIGVNIGVHRVPPFLFAGSRFVLAGAALLTWSAWRDGWRLQVSWRDVAAAGVVGLGLILGGQGSVSWAAQSVAPGVLAVLVTLAPIWIALISWLVLRRPLPLPAVIGTVAAFGGVIFLASPASGGGGTSLLPAVLVAGGGLAWAAASVYGSRTAISRRPLVATGIQLAVGGAAQLVTGLALGEPARFHLAEMAGPAGLAWVFLLLGPSLIGFPLFTWLLANTSPAVANSQAYASPVVALVLSWLLLAAPFGLSTVLAAGVILGGVALIVSTASRPAPRAESAPEDEPDECAAA